MTIHDKTGYDALSSSPIDFAKNVTIPGIFLVAEFDKISPTDKVQKMFNKYGSDKKKLHIMKGREHADSREQEDYLIASKYLRHLLQLYNADTDEKMSKTKLQSMTLNKFDNETDVPDEQISISVQLNRSIPSNIQAWQNFSGTGSSFDSEQKEKIKELVITNEGQNLISGGKKGLTLTTGI